MKIATAKNIDRLEKLINEYYCSTSCKVKEGNVYNLKGIIKGVEVVQNKGRFIFQTTLK